MKKILVFTIIAAFTFLSACRKSDNPKLPELTRVPVPLITKDLTGDGTISKDNPAGFKGKFIVDLYFKDGPKPAKFDVVVIKNGDKTNVKHIQDGVTAFPTTVNVTGAQLITLFGSAIVLGDKFTIGVNLTTAAGQFFEAFPPGPGSVAYGSGLINQPGASTQIDYIAVCPFDISQYVGPATANDPYFWEDSYPVTVTLEGTNGLRVKGINQTPSESVLITINPATLDATVTKQIIDPAPPFFSYTNLAMEGKGTVDACNKRINMNITWTVSQGSFGAGPFSVIF